MDFRTQARELTVPVYIFHGRKEANAMPALVEEYYRVLDAPHKELIWLEDSGHDALYMEPAKIEDLLVNRVLAQTDPRR